jgi:hypothetical protein
MAYAGAEHWLSEHWLSEHWLSEHWLSEHWLSEHWLSKYWQLRKHWRLDAVEKREPDRNAKGDPAAEMRRGHRLSEVD